MTDKPGWVIAKTIRFAAAHKLSGLPQGHKCGRVHGHNWQADITVAGWPDPGTGMVADYGLISDLLVSVLDHQWLGHGVLYEDHPNAAGTGGQMTRIPPVLGDLNPTAENLAAWIHTRLRTAFPEAGRITVTVRETEGTSATYDPGPGRIETRGLL